jgi:hypothetical protein
MKLFYTSLINYLLLIYLTTNSFNVVKSLSKFSHKKIGLKNKLKLKINAKNKNLKKQGKIKN